MGRRIAREFGVTALLLLWCAALLLARSVVSHSTVYGFLVWNLFLAGLPLAFAAAMRFASSRPALLGLGACWLLLFPNAPYILTDLLHLQPKQNIPLWFDLLLLLSAAGTGLVMGLLSLRHVHDLVRDRFGALPGWLFIAAIAFLSGFGVYLGRFARWNSWDVLAAPWSLASDVAHRILWPAQHIRTWSVTIGFGTLLLLVYATVHVFSSGTADDPERRA